MSDPGLAPPLDLRLVPAALTAWAVCAVAVGLSSSAAAAAAVVAGSGGLGCVVLLVARPGIAAVGWVRVGGLVLVSGGVALGSCALQLAERDSGPLGNLVQAGAVVEVVGVVRSEPAPLRTPWGGEGWRTTVAVHEVAGRGSRGPAQASVLVLGDAAWGGIAHGSPVVVRGRLSPAPVGRDVLAILTAQGEVGVGEPGPVDRAVARLRRGLLAASDRLPADQRGLVPGAAIGDTSRVPPELTEAMRDVGLAHITAVSGGHFAVLSTAVLALTAGLPRRIRAVACCAALTGFVILVHPEPSVVRAAGMGTVGLLGLAGGRRSRAVPALAGTVLVLVVVDPWLARSFGFVLSAVATAAIVLLAPVLAARAPTRLPRWLALTLAVPVAAQAACAPVVVLLDPAVSAYAVPANLLAAPALVPATILGVAATLVTPLWEPAGAALATAAGVPCWWIAAVARTAAGMTGARVAWPAGPGGAALLAALTACVLVAALARWRWQVHPSVRLGGAVLAAGVLVVGLLPGHLGRVIGGGWPPADWRVVMCDVGQGDALVVRTGPGSAIVVDVGPDGPAAGRCLDDLGVRTVDLLVLSHHHADHVGGLAAVLTGREVTAALVSPLPQPEGQARRTLSALHGAGVPVLVGVAGAGDTGAGVPGAGTGGSGTAGSGTAGDVRWRVLWPTVLPVPADVARGAPGADASAGATVEAEVNDASVVLLIEPPGLSIVALGDVEPPAQAALLSRVPPLAGARVLKVAHHGSAHQSSELTRLLAPDVALVGAGEENTYGHPAPTTVDLLAGLGALVLSTDVCGPVAVAADGTRLTVTAACLGRALP